VESKTQINAVGQNQNPALWKWYGARIVYTTIQTVALTDNGILNQRKKCLLLEKMIFAATEKRL
jgi:hypothetical protein